MAPRAAGQGPARALAYWLVALIALDVVVAGLRLALAPTEVVVNRHQVNLAAPGLLGLLGSFVGVATVAVGLTWIYQFVHSASVGGKPSAGWALGSCFIPLAHMVLPFFPIRDAARKRGVPVALVTAWWSTYAVSLLAAYVGGSWGFAIGVNAALVNQGVVAPYTVALPPGLVVVQWIGFACMAVAGVLFATVALQVRPRAARQFA